MPGRNRVPSFQLASGTTNERDGSYNLTTLGSIFYNTDTSNVEISGNLELAGDVSISAVIADNVNVGASSLNSDTVVCGDISADVISADVIRANSYTVSGGGNISGNFSIVRNIYVDINTTTRSTSSWTYYPLPDAWPTRTYRGGSRLHVFYAVTVTNENMGWGGCYSRLYYKINNGLEYSLGDGGYTDVMTNGAQHIAVHHRTFFLDFSHNDTNVDFSCQFIPKNRPYSSTLKTNTNTNHGTGDTNPYYVETKQNYAKMIITEYGPNS